VLISTALLSVIFVARAAEQEVRVKWSWRGSRDLGLSPHKIFEINVCANAILGIFHGQIENQEVHK